MRRLARSLFLLCLAAGGAAAATLPARLRVCGDAAEFPPFSYFKRDGAVKTDTVAGFDVDVLQRIAARAGLTLTVELLPWSRCLALARLGRYDIVLDGIKSPVRERDFLFPRPHYTITPVFVYLSHRPKPDMRSKQAMGLLRVCSLADYNYEPYGIPPSHVTNSPRSVTDAARMLRLGRCDVLIYVEEILRGQAALGGLDVINNADFSREVPLWIERVGFYFLVGRKLAYRDELVELLDRGIAALKADGELERLRRHAVGGPR